MGSFLGLANPNCEFKIENSDENTENATISGHRLVTKVRDRTELQALIGYEGQVVTQINIALSYEWDSSVVLGDDNGGTVIYVSDEGGWRAKYTGAVSIEWFDVVSNDTLFSAQNTSILQGVLDEFREIVADKTKQYFIEGIEVRNSNTQVYGLNLRLALGVNKNILQVTEGANNVTIDSCETHFTLQGGGYDVSGIDIYKANDVTIKNCYTDGSYNESYSTSLYTNANISAYQCYHLTIDNCYATNGIYETIMIKDCYYSKITRCTIQNTYGSLGTSIGSHNLVSDCIALNVHHSSISVNSKYTTVSNCVVSGTYSTDGFHGINVGHVGVDRSSEGCVVSGCTVEGQNNSGIAIASPRDVTITGNTIRNSGDYGIYVIGDLEDIIINGNSITNSTLQGIYATNSEDAVDSSCTISSNSIKDSGKDGIYLDKIDNFTINGNNILNVADDQSVLSSYIYLSYLGGGTISGNKCATTAVNKPLHGFRFETNDSLSFCTTISNNVILDYTSTISGDATDSSSLRDLVTWINNRISLGSMETIQDVTETSAGTAYACLNSNLCGFAKFIIYPLDQYSAGANIYVTEFPEDVNNNTGYFRYTAGNSLTGNASSFKVKVL